MGSERRRFKPPRRPPSIALRTQVIVAVDCAPEVPVQRPVEWHALDEEDCGELVCRIAPEDRRRTPAQEKSPNSPAILAGGLRLAGTHKKIDPKTAISLARQP